MKPHCLSALLLLLAAAPAGVFISGCSSASASASLSGSSNTSYVAAYKALTWGSAAAVSFPSECSMTITTTGVPPSHNPYYLAPTSAEYPTPVAYGAASHTAYSVVPYTPSAISGDTMTLNICPVKASTPTQTQGGTIGFVLSGEALFNGGDGAGVSAMSDQASYTFKDVSGASQTAYFIDQCNSHPTPLSGGYAWHHHATPVCLTATLDGATGPSHILGIALDGYPIYGGRDINGNLVTTAQLDSCNGITSPTPEFPEGAYHYVLPLNVTSYQSSIGCYTGTVAAGQMAQAYRRHCDMRTMLSGHHTHGARETLATGM